ncbi:MAG: hypothetical protein KDB66_04380 [Solirubrobacterales bacterium]|nr:hypothetical protein [Solirubrobacterales bacterium]
MEREHLVRDDFPKTHGSEGFDVDSVGAHLAAVAAHVAALEARITALQVECDTLRSQLSDARDQGTSPSGLPDPAGPDPLGNLSEEPVPESSPSGNEAAARMLASKLAMGGTSRDTIVMQVAARHEIDDPGALVDDVLARLA